MLYAELVLSCKLHGYLADINVQAQTKLGLLVKQMAKTEGVTEQLKEQDQMAWVSAMNSIRNCAEEIIHQELIYGEEVA